MSPPPGGGDAAPAGPFRSVLESFAMCFSPNVGPGEGPPPTRTVSGSDSSSGSRGRLPPTADYPRALDQLDVSYDADGVARAKRAHNRVLSSEAIEERSTRRRLEIFRRDGYEENRRRPPPPSGAMRFSGRRGRRSRPGSPALSLSDDEEELVRLASGGRFACGVDTGRDGPISNVTRLFNLGVEEARRPFGLCFATPVRSASREDVANMSDDKLTDDEFFRRHQGVGGENEGVTVTPEADDSRSSYDEDETISSTLYFESKYSHVAQTRPPMPLFQEYAVACETDAAGEGGGPLAQIVRARKADGGGGGPPVTEILGRGSSSVKGGGSVPRSNGGSSGGHEKKGAGDGGLPSPERISDSDSGLGALSNRSSFEQRRQEESQ